MLFTLHNATAKIPSFLNLLVSNWEAVTKMRSSFQSLDEQVLTKDERKKKKVVSDGIQTFDLSLSKPDDLASPGCYHCETLEQTLVTHLSDYPDVISSVF